MNSISNNLGLNTNIKIDISMNIESIIDFIKKHYSYETPDRLKKEIKGKTKDAIYNIKEDEPESVLRAYTLIILHGLVGSKPDTETLKKYANKCHNYHINPESVKFDTKTEKISYENKNLKEKSVVSALNKTLDSLIKSSLDNKGSDRFKKNINKNAKKYVQKLKESDSEETRDYDNILTNSFIYTIIGINAFNSMNTGRYNRLKSDFLESIKDIKKFPINVVLPDNFIYD